MSLYSTVMTPMSQTYIAVLASMFNVLVFTCPPKDMRDVFVVTMSLLHSISCHSFSMADDGKKSKWHQISMRKGHLLNSIKLFAC